MSSRTRTAEASTAAWSSWQPKQSLRLSTKRSSSAWLGLGLGIGLGLGLGLGSVLEVERRLQLLLERGGVARHEGARAALEQHVPGRQLGLEIESGLGSGRGSG